VPATTLSEAASKALLAPHGVPVPAERLAATAVDAVGAAEELGFPVVVKLCGNAIAHKTERGLVRLGLATGEAVRDAADELLAAIGPSDAGAQLLVAPMIKGNRELMAGLARDPQFGMTVMLGVGGVLAEAIADVVFRLVPITAIDAHDMIDDLQVQSILGEFRGEPPVDRDRLARVLVGLSEFAESHPDVVSVDVNPLIIAEGIPVAVDALVEVEA
jgi:acetyl-CoA synthetase (ADP-forming)